jgi:hypothetical protein
MLRRSRTLLTVGTLLVAGLASAPSYAVRLTSLSVDVAPLAPSFQGGVFNYTATAPASAAQARVTARPAGFGSTVRVNGVSVMPGVPSAPLALAVGQTTITVTSTGRANWWSPITTDTYRIVVTRPSPGSPPSITSIQAERLVVESGRKPRSRCDRHRAAPIGRRAYDHGAGHGFFRHRRVRHGGRAHHEYAAGHYGRSFCHRGERGHIRHLHRYGVRRGRWRSRVHVALDIES